MRTQATSRTIDEAIEWLARMVQRGVYSSNTGRLMKVAAESVRALLAPEEPRTLDYVLQNREQLYSRLLNRSTSLSAASASTYFSRAERLMRDYQRWSEDPAGLQPRPSRARASKGIGYSRQKREGAQEEAQDFSGSDRSPPGGPAFFSRGWDLAGPTTYREHLLALSTGRAYIKLPEIITPADLKLIMAVVNTHCSGMGPVAPEKEQEGDETGKH
jgi:hypothetical protein